MAKAFLTIEQVCAQLGVTVDDVKSMVDEGRLSEIRDAGKIFYREEEIERLAAKEGSSVVDLAVADDQPAPVLDETDSFASALSSLADSSSGLSLLEGSGAGVSSIDEVSPVPTAGQPAGTAPQPEEMDLSGIPEQLPAAGADSGGPTELSSEIGLLPADEADQASLADDERPSDLGLSGSDVIKLDTADDAKKKAKEDTRITSAGISVFDDDELDIEADPMEKTHVASAVEDFDAIGSGSGLLDLTRESDDTSLGQILDVISPTEAAETEAEATVDDDAVVAEDSAGFAAMAAEQPMGQPAAVVRRRVTDTPGAVPLNVCLLLGVLAMALLGLATATQIQGVFPSLLVPIASGVIYMSVAGGLLLIALVTGVVGIVAGRK